MSSIAKKICGVEGCGKKVYCRLMCINHYQSFLKRGGPRITEHHGMEHTSEYEIWCTMKKRCYTKTSDRYPYYGGRGIKVCERWRNSFTAFYEDMGPRPSKSHSIDRVDNDKNYSPENCKWATKQEQANNRRSNVLFTINGVTRNMKQWADSVGISHKIVHYRIRKRGMTIEQALGIDKSL